MTPTATDPQRRARRGTVILSLIVGATQVGYLVALLGPLSSGTDDRWAFGVFVVATTMAVGGWLLLVAHAVTSASSSPGSVVHRLPTASLALGVGALGLFLALLVLSLTLSLGADLLALGAFAEAGATMVLVYQAWVVRARLGDVSA